MYLNLFTNLGTAHQPDVSNMECFDAVGIILVAVRIIPVAVAIFFSAVAIFLSAVAIILYAVSIMLNGVGLSQAVVGPRLDGVASFFAICVFSILEFGYWVTFLNANPLTCAYSGLVAPNIDLMYFFTWGGELIG